MAGAGAEWGGEGVPRGREGAERQELRWRQVLLWRRGGWSVQEGMERAGAERRQRAVRERHRDEEGGTWGSVQSGGSVP